MNQSRINTAQWQRLRLRILRRDNYTCNYCGGVATQVDHIIPRASGGDNSPDNLTAACASCNASKKDKPATVFSKQIDPPTPVPHNLSPMVRFDPI